MFHIDDAQGQYLAYVPLTEREDEEVQLTPLTRIFKVPEEEREKNLARKVISDIILSYDAEAEMTGEETWNLINQLMDSRHNVWYHAIIENLRLEWQSLHMDAKFQDFCSTFLGISPSKIPGDMKNLTPDIMVFSETKKLVIIGDISVTKALHSSDKLKTIKYDKLVKFLLKELSNISVQQHNFIVKEDLDNIPKLVHLFKQSLELISSDYQYNLDLIISDSANYMIRILEDKCRDKKVFNKYKEGLKHDKNVKLSVNLDNLLDPDLQADELEDYVPRDTEVDIINMIKDEVDRLGGASYYDTSLEKINDAFSKVEDDNNYNTITDGNGDIKKVVKEIKQPKSTLKVCDNSHDYNIKSDYELLNDYVLEIASEDPSDIRDYMLALLPTTPQIKMMKKVKDNKISRKDIVNHSDITTAKVYGQYQYTRRRRDPNNITINFETKITEGSKKKGKLNDKKPTTRMDPKELNDNIDFIDNAIRYYGSLSDKPNILDDTWDYSNGYEKDHSRSERTIYEYVKSTNGAQLGHALSALHNRITHMSAYAGSHDNVFIPPNGSFIAIMPNNHSPVTSANCDMPFIFMTRSKSNQVLSHVECEYKLKCSTHTYYISKLSRLNTRTISCWDNAGYKLVASSTYLLSRSQPLISVKEKIVGLLTYITLDVHQKVSEYLDLLKYVGFMPFADLHKLEDLILDKCSLIMKTRMDLWMFNRFKVFVNELSNINKLEASKPMLTTLNGIPTKESLGISMKLPSFCDPNIRHDKPDDYIEELNVLNTSRPKHLYGSQFSDASTHNTVQWNIDYDEEVIKYGSWAKNGLGDGVFPFNSKFCFSADAIHYATKELEAHITASSNTISSGIINGYYGGFMHDNCSLRGCAKEVSDRKTQTDIHTTSISACFEKYEKDNFDDDKARALVMGQEFLSSPADNMEFAMSEKDQRGSGRPIATPTLGTKAALMLIEKPEAVFGKYMPNNILVAGKDKLKEQHIAYTLCIAEGVRRNMKQVYQLTEDQTKYSENDNTRKYIPYIMSNTLIPLSIRKLQVKTLSKLTNRVHLVKRIPKTVLTNPILNREVVNDDKHLGVQSRIGWPQGMLNNISTSIHCAADYWIVKAFRIAYPRHRIVTYGLCHSDDSWVTIACNSLETFKLFSLFRTKAKALFCLKINVKKLWGGKFLGELVSHYNLNGHVHMSTGKVICNGLSNLTYQNWPIDVSNQISTIQQSYRAGATIPDLIMLSTILRQQINSAYQIVGLQKRLLHYLPIELGGYPRGSVFRLAISGIHAHYSDVHRLLTTATLDADKQFIKETVLRIMSGAIYLAREVDDDKLMDKDDDYISVEMPTKGEIFKAVKHLMPKSRKMAYAISVIKRIVAKPEFASDGLALIVPRPNTLAESIGHYGDTAKSRQFELSAERYTQSHRKLATSQAMQSAGKTVRIVDSVPLTFNEAYTLLQQVDIKPMDEETAIKSMESDNEVVIACDTITHTCVLEKSTASKGKVINRMPDINNIYNTVSPLQDVLLQIIDIHCRTNYFDVYSSGKTSFTTLLNDVVDIQDRFRSFFTYFNAKTACKLIMQNKMATIKERSWIQPKVSADSLPSFLEDLYGSTISRDAIYRVRANRNYMTRRDFDAEVVNDIYSCLVLNGVYEDKVKLCKYGNLPVEEAISKVNISVLDYNTSLKHAVCQHVINNNKDYLNKTISNDRFAYEWLIAQKRTDEGKYVGDWMVKFTYSDIVCQASSTLGVTTLIVNKLNNQKIMRAMRLMTHRCFSKHAYEYDNAWWTSKVWNSNGPPPEGHELYLCWINSFETIIKNGPVKSSICMAVDPNLSFQSHSGIIEPIDYTYEDNYRVIKAQIMDMVGQEKSYRIANVYQDLKICHPDKIQLEVDYIEGFLNSTLLKTKILEDLMLNRSLTVSIEKAQEMIDLNSDINMHLYLLKVYSNLFHYANGFRPPEVLKFVEQKVNVSVATIDVIAVTTTEVFQNREQPVIESLENIAIEYDCNLMKGSKRIFKPNDIKREICRHIHKMQPRNTHLDFISSLLQSVDIYRWINMTTQEMVHALMDELHMHPFIEYDRSLFCFLYANRLECTDAWDCILRSSLKPQNRDNNNIVRIKYLTYEFINAINNNFFDEELYVPTATFMDTIT